MENGTQSFNNILDERLEIKGKNVRYVQFGGCLLRVVAKSNKRAIRYARQFMLSELPLGEPKNDGEQRQPAPIGGTLYAASLAEDARITTTEVEPEVRRAHIKFLRLGITREVVSPIEIHTPTDPDQLGKKRLFESSPVERGLLDQGIHELPTHIDLSKQELPAN